MGREVIEAMGVVSGRFRGGGTKSSEFYKHRVPVAAGKSSVRKKQELTWEVRSWRAMWKQKGPFLEQEKATGEFPPWMIPSGASPSHQPASLFQATSQNWQA